MARGFLAGRARREDCPTERRGSDDYAQKIYGRPNDLIVAAAIGKGAAARGFAPAQVALAWTLSSLA